MTAGSSSSISDLTPILDSGLRPKGVKRKRLGNTLFGLVLGLLFAGVLIQSSNSARDARNPIADFAVFFYFLAIALVVTVHELGHLTAGWLVGFRFSFIAVGPLSLKLEYGRLKLHFRSSMPAAGYAGMHINRVRRLRRRLLIFTVAGPLSNLLAAGVTAIFLYYPFPVARSVWHYLPAHIFFQISLITGLVNLLPFRLGVLFTDGARIAMLLRSPARSQRWMCLMAVGNQSQQGVRPRNWRSTWVPGASSLHDGDVDDFAGHWIAYVYANDRKDAPVAASNMEKCLEQMNQLGVVTQDIVALEAAVFSAWFRNDVATAEKWVGQIKKLKAIPQLQRTRADVALLCARMEYDHALSAWERGRAFIEALPVNEVQKRLNDSWKEWQSEICERKLAMKAPASDHEAMVPTRSTSA